MNRPIYKLLDWIDEKKINWYNFSFNLKSIELLKANPDKINWNNLSSNLNIFELDYKQIKINFEPFQEELITVVLNPDRIKRLSFIYNFEFKNWILSI